MPVAPDLALESIRSFSPQKWAREDSLSHLEYLARDEEADKLIRLAAEFVQSLPENRTRELRRRFQALIGGVAKGTPFDRARLKAFETIQGADRLSNDPEGLREDWGRGFLSHFGTALFPYALDAAWLTCSMRLNSAADPATTKKLRRWSEELWQYIQMLKREGSWGSYLLLAAHSTHHGACRADRKAHEQLVTGICGDLPGVWEAMVEVADELVRKIRWESSEPPGLPLSKPHDEHFSTLHWNGEDFTFTVNQSQVVKILYERWRNGVPWVKLCDLLDGTDSDSTRLVDVFKNHKTWKRLIVPGKGPGGKKGKYRLVEPNTEQLTRFNCHG